MLDAQYCVEKAEQCFRLVKLAKQPIDTRDEIAVNLEALGHELMTKAVEIETRRQKSARNR
jgi:hypothetical protein